MASHILVTFFAIAAAIALFSVPLVLKYRVYGPQNKSVVSGEVLTLDDRFSSVWCQGLELESELNFDSFKFDTEPALDESHFERTLSKTHIVLPNHAQEYWGFRLLRGSVVNISACSRLPRADVTVVKGFDGLKKCLQEHRKKLHDDAIIGEDSLSESESDAGTSSISSSQGVITNETDSPYICSNSIDHAELLHSYRCLKQHPDGLLKSALLQKILETDHYFYIFASTTYLDVIPNHISLEMAIDRTQYEYSTSNGNCSSGHHCLMSVPLAADLKFVVKMENTNSTLKTRDLEMTCRPREWIFFIFYGSFFVVIFLCAFH